MKLDLLKEAVVAIMSVAFTLGGVYGYLKMRGERITNVEKQLDHVPNKDICEERHSKIDKVLERLPEMAEMVARIDERTKAIARSNGVDE